MKKKFLFVISGESFRYGHQGSRGRGGDESYVRQKIAVTSQTNFIDFIKEKYDIDCDLFFSIYKFSENWDNNFFSWYKKPPLFINNYDNLLGEGMLHSNIISYMYNNINLNNYDFVLFVRADLFLKKYFYEIFDPFCEKVKYAHINEITDKVGKSYNYIPNTEIPAVNHQIFFVPKKYYRNLVYGSLWNNHHSYVTSLRGGLKQSDITFFLNTYHSSSTDITWNPIFHQVGREETDFWVDQKYRVNPETHHPIVVEDTNPYDKLINNDYKDFII
jgi:hypothetical protein